MSIEKEFKEEKNLKKEVNNRFGDSMEERSLDKHVIYLFAVFVTSIIVANITSGIKLINLLGFVVPVGFIAYAITFTITDILGDVYGKEVSYVVVRAGFIANMVMLSLVYLGMVLPSLTPGMQNLYVKALTPTARIVFASMTAYLVSQHHDVWAFHFWKRKTNGKHLWLRNNASTVVSQGIDTLIFITLAFYGVVPNNVLLTMILCQWLWKIVVALLDTPFVYLGVKLLKGE